MLKHIPPLLVLAALSSVWCQMKVANNKISQCAQYVDLITNHVDILKNGNELTFDKITENLCGDVLVKGWQCRNYKKKVPIMVSMITNGFTQSAICNFLSQPPNESFTITGTKSSPSCLICKTVLDTIKFGVDVSKWNSKKVKTGIQTLCKRFAMEYYCKKIESDSIVQWILTGTTPNAICEKLQLCKQRNNNKEIVGYLSINRNFKPRQLGIKPRLYRLIPRKDGFRTLIPRYHQFRPHQHRFRSRQHRFRPHQHRFRPRQHRFKPRQHRFRPRQHRFRPRHHRFRPHRQRFRPRHHRYRPHHKRHHHRFHPHYHKHHHGNKSHNHTHHHHHYEHHHSNHTHENHTYHHTHNHTYENRTHGNYTHHYPRHHHYHHHEHHHRHHPHHHRHHYKHHHYGHHGTDSEDEYQKEDNAHNFEEDFTDDEGKDYIDDDESEESVEDDEKDVKDEDKDEGEDEKEDEDNEDETNTEEAHTEYWGKEVSAESPATEITTKDPTSEAQPAKTKDLTYPDIDINPYGSNFPFANIWDGKVYDGKRG